MLISIYWHGGDPAYFGDAAFASLAKLSNLDAIDVQGHFPSPTDAVLDEWSKIRTLKHLGLSIDEPKRQYIATGIAKFREARPDVSLTIDGKDS